MRVIHPNRRGQVLVEFAVIAVILYLLLAGTFEFGRAIYCAQVIQQSADLCAREISRTPLSATATFSDALQDTKNVLPHIYDKHKLVIQWARVQAEYPNDPEALVKYSAQHLPLVNQQLLTVMVNDTIDDLTVDPTTQKTVHTSQQVLRYPGEIRKDSSPSDPDFPYFIVVPLVVSRGANGVETIERVDVVEEVKPPLPLQPPYQPGDEQPFSITAPTFRGVVALRINYPYQAATLSGFEQVPGPYNNQVIQANDAGVQATDPNNVLGTSMPVMSGNLYGPNTGTYGLGDQAALGKQVRPFRKVLSAQAIYRREVFN